MCLAGQGEGVKGQWMRQSYADELLQGSDYMQ